MELNTIHNIFIDIKMTNNNTLFIYITFHIGIFRNHGATVCSEILKKLKISHHAKLNTFPAYAYQHLSKKIQYENKLLSKLSLCHKKSTKTALKTQAKKLRTNSYSILGSSCEWLIKLFYALTLGYGLHNGIYNEILNCRCDVLCVLLHNYCGISTTRRELCCCEAICVDVRSYDLKRITRNPVCRFHNQCSSSQIPNLSNGKISSSCVKR